jgi:hypothetical protein
VIAEQVYVPHDETAGGEVVGALGRHRGFGGLPVFIFASHFHRKNRRAVNEVCR